MLLLIIIFILGRNGIKEINSAILRDIVIVIIYLFTKYTIINL